MNGNGGNSFSDARRDKSLLGRLGDELAVMYHGTLQASLPAGLQALVNQLAAAEADRDGGDGVLRDAR